MAQKGYSGFVHQLPTLFTVRFGDLKVGMTPGSTGQRPSASFASDECKPVMYRRG